MVEGIPCKLFFSEEVASYGNHVAMIDFEPTLHTKTMLTNCGHENGWIVNLVLYPVYFSPSLVNCYTVLV